MKLTLTRGIAYNNVYFSNLGECICAEFVRQYLRRLPKNIELTISRAPFKGSKRVFFFIFKSINGFGFYYSFKKDINTSRLLYPSLGRYFLSLTNEEAADDGVTFYFKINEAK